MGRGRPTYDLQELQRLVGQGAISSLITRTAADNAIDIGLEEHNVVDAVLLLGPEHFYKSMEAEKCPGLWQDVYHLDYRGKWLYIKLQLLPDGRAGVVQFKLK